MDTTLDVFMPTPESLAAMAEFTDWLREYIAEHGQRARDDMGLGRIHYPIALYREAKP